MSGIPDIAREAMIAEPIYVTMRKERYIWFASVASGPFKLGEVQAITKKQLMGKVEELIRIYYDHIGAV